MKLRAYLFLAGLGLVVALIPALFQTAPGYMDADYYFSGGLRLAGGHGFSELVLWNYLDDPTGLPHPSHGYWMPLPSILAALGMALVGAAKPGAALAFAAARGPFWLLAGVVPPLTARLALALTGQARPAWLAGLLAALPGFYLAYLTAIDAFAPVMVCGGLFFWLLAREDAGAPPAALDWRAVGLGVLAGLVHLCRADGLIWLPVGILAVAWSQAGRPGRMAKRAAWVLIGYLLIAGPWMLRNLAVFGAPLAPGGGRALWITQYDDLFLFPAGQLTLGRWLQTGLAAAGQARLWAAGQNLQTALAVQGMIVLWPVILIGAWRLRSRRMVQIAGLVWAALFVALTLVFPFQSARGGFFHSGAAFQPLFWALAAAGFEACLDWGVRRRGWEARRAWRMFGGLLLALALGLGGLMAFQRIRGGDPAALAWNADAQRNQRIEQALLAWGAGRQDVVMANNPPGYYAVTGRPAIVIPAGDLAMVQAAAARYQARYLLIEIEQVQDESLHARPGDRPGLRYLGAVEKVTVYDLQNPEP